MSTTPTVILLGTLDTKGPEHAYVRDRLREAGVRVTLVDVGILDHPTVEPDVAAHDVARAAGTSLEELRVAGLAAGHRAIALEAMARGASALVARWRAEGRCDGVMGLGGSGGSAIVSAVLRSLPIGVPKLLVSTMTSGDTRAYVGTRDLTLVHPVTDIQGLNRVSRRVLTNAANAMAGMVRGPGETPATDAPLVAISMMGVTTLGAQGVQRQVEATGYETIVFHANGAGGMAMEELIGSGAVDGVIDLTTNELTSEPYGGILSAGPGRLTTAGRLGVPQVVAPGALEVINFGPRASLPERFSGPDRRIVIHSASVTSVRANADEAAEIGARFAARVNVASGPTAVLAAPGTSSPVGPSSTLTPTLRCSAPSAPGCGRTSPAVTWMPISTTLPSARPRSRPSSGCEGRSDSARYGGSTVAPPGLTGERAARPPRGRRRVTTLTRSARSPMTLLTSAGASARSSPSIRAATMTAAVALPASSHLGHRRPCIVDPSSPERTRGGRAGAGSLVT